MDMCGRNLDKRLGKSWSPWWLVSTRLRKGMPRELVRHYFWVCLWGYFLKRWAFMLVNWIRQRVLPSVSGLHAEHPNRSKRHKINSFSAWAEMSIFSCPSSLVLLVFRLSESDGNWHHQPHLILRSSGWNWISPLAYLVLQLSDGRWWDFSASITP